MPVSFPFTVTVDSATPVVDSGPLPFGENVITNGVVDHYATAINRLAEFIRQQPNFLQLLGAPIKQVQDLETAFQQLLTLRALPNATGGQLDVIGAILTQPRNGQTDNLYRKYLQARILLNRSSGTIEQILEIFGLITSSAAVQIKEFQPAAFELHLYGAAITPPEVALYTTILNQARSAAVGAQFHWTEYTPATTFTLDGTPAQSLDAGHLSGIV